MDDCPKIDAYDAILFLEDIRKELVYVTLNDDWDIEDVLAYIEDIVYTIDKEIKDIKKKEMCE
jgi:hypothetical protein